MDVIAAYLLHLLDYPNFDFYYAQHRKFHPYQLHRSPCG